MLRPVGKTLAASSNTTSGINNTCSTTSSAAPVLCEANAFADVLGISPSYRQRESIRWNSAMQMYKQMSSSQDLTNGFDSTANISTSTAVERNLHLVVPDSGTGDATPGSASHQLSPKSVAAGDASSACTSPTLPSTYAQRHMQHRSSCHSAIVSPFVSVPICLRYGYMTPPANGSMRLGAGERRSIDTGTGLLFGFNHFGGEELMNNLPRSSSTEDTRHLLNAVKNDLNTMFTMNESSLNALELEAIAAVHELQFAVKDMFVSELLPRTSDLIFLNITTAEGQPHCVELTTKGWRVTSLRHDYMNGDLGYINLHTKYFETIYALMDTISARYREYFSNKLAEKLAVIQQENDDDDDGDAQETGNKTTRQQIDEQPVAVDDGSSSVAESASKDSIGRNLNADHAIKMTA